MNLGYGTVLRAACACQGCSASDHHHHHHHHHHELWLRNVVVYLHATHTPSWRSARTVSHLIDVWRSFLDKYSRSVTLTTRFHPAEY
jgi:hypothetical protein